MKILLLLLVILCLISCQKDIEQPSPETDAPITEAVPEIPAETTPEPDTASAGEETVPSIEEPPVETVNEAMDFAAQFQKHTWVITDWGDLVQLEDGEGKTIIPDETMADTYNVAVTISLPRTWEMTATTAQDIPRSEAGIYATKRLEYWQTGVYLTSANPEGREERTNAGGHKYYYWEQSGEALWHHCEFAVPLGDKEYYFMVYFLTFPNHREGSDPADYFDTYIQTAIDSVTIEVLDVHAVRYMPVKQKMDQGSADVVEVPVPSYTEVQFHSNLWGDYVDDPINRAREFIRDETMAITEAVAWLMMDWPDSWKLEETNVYDDVIHYIATDIPRQNADVYATGRMKLMNTLYLSSRNPEERYIRWNAQGTKYYYWESMGEEYPAKVFHMEIVVPYSEKEYLYYLCFSTYPDDQFADDPADYFEVHIQPVIDSIVVEVPV